MSTEFTYKKSLNHNYLVAPWPGGDDWQLNMLLENSIPGLLPLSLRFNEGKEELYYEISSLQPLGRVYDHKEISSYEAGQLMQNISDGISALQEYMLEEDCLRISPELLYVDPENLKPHMLYIPGSPQSLREQLLGLAEYFMEHMEQSDPAAAMWAYRLYKRLRNENFVLSELSEMGLPGLNMSERGAAARDSAARRGAKILEAEDTELSESAASQSFKEDDSFLSGEDEDLLLSFGDDDGEEERPLPWWRKLFGGKKEKASKEKASKGKRSFGKKKDAEVEFDFSEAFADMEAVDEGQPAVAEEEAADEDYGKTVFLGNADEPVENVLIEKNKGLRIPMKKFPFTIGKVKDKVDLPLSDNSVSRIHARIFMQDGRAYLKDCNSTNGTYINGIQLQAEEEVMLEREDEIKIGRVVFCYC